MYWQQNGSSLFKRISHCSVGGMRSPLSHLLIYLVVQTDPADG